jgi:hypothetical protein
MSIPKLAINGVEMNRDDDENRPSLKPTLDIDGANVDKHMQPRSPTPSLPKLTIIRSETNLDDDYDWRPYPKPALDIDGAHSVFLSNIYTPFDREQHEAYRKLRALFERPAKNRKKSLVYEAFGYLDVILFQGMLKSRVKIGYFKKLWNKDAPAETRPAYHPDSQSRWIVLAFLESTLSGIDSKWRYSRAWAWGTLIHEMLHAYHLILIDGPAWETCTCGALVYHGSDWRAAIQRIVVVLDIPRLVPEDLDDHVNMRRCHYSSIAEQEYNRQLEAQHGKQRIEETTNDEEKPKKEGGGRLMKLRRMIGALLLR